MNDSTAHRYGRVRRGGYGWEFGRRHLRRAVHVEVDEAEAIVDPPAEQLVRGPRHGLAAHVHHQLDLR